MKHNIFSAFRRYNANVRDTNAPDCVKRAISFALGWDYNDVSRSLNNISKMRTGTTENYNTLNVFAKFLKDQGCPLMDQSSWPKPFSVEEFCEQNPSGTYVLEVHDGHNRNNHLVAVMNGDIYDSWDCSKYVIRRGWSVPHVSSPVLEFSLSEVSEVFYPDIEKYANKLIARAQQITDLVSFSVGPLEEDKYNRDSNGSTYEFTIVIKFCDQDADPDGVVQRLARNNRLGCWGSWSPYGRSLRKYFTIKLNIRKSLEENFKSSRQRIHDMIYNAIIGPCKNIELEEERVARSTDAKKIDFDEYKFLKTLPKWVQDNARYVDIQDYLAGRDYSDNIRISVDPLPGDPDPDPVLLYGSNKYELDYVIKKYEEDFYRGGF